MKAVQLSHRRVTERGVGPHAHARSRATEDGPQTKRAEHLSGGWQEARHAQPLGWHPRVLLTTASTSAEQRGQRHRVVV